MPDLPSLVTFGNAARAMLSTGPRPWSRALKRQHYRTLAGAARPGLTAGFRVRPWALICLLSWTSGGGGPTAATLLRPAALIWLWCTLAGAGPAAAGGIDLRPGEPLRVRKIRPVDCRLVRGFTHSPVDGRVDTRYANGAQWASGRGSTGPRR